MTERDTNAPPPKLPEPEPTRSQKAPKPPKPRKVERAAQGSQGLEREASSARRSSEMAAIANPREVTREIRNVRQARLYKPDPVPETC